jgi:hypothetical protein
VAGAERPKVVDVVGAGRSGSTIIGVALGNCRDVFCAGELHLWIGRGGKSPIRGANRDERAEFWARVKAEVEVPADFPHREARLLEKSGALFRIDHWRAQRRLRAPYRRITEQLYRAVSQAAGVAHVIDTSHFPRRALELQALPGIDLYLLFVVRDPRGVVSSYSRDEVDFRQFNVLTTNAYLWLTYALSVLAFLRHPRRRRLVVRYEQFMADPEGVLSEILAWIGAPAGTPDLSALRTGFAFQGNNLLRQEVVALERRPEQHVQGSRLTRLLNLPWTLLFSRLRPTVASGARSPDRDAELSR